MGKPNRDIPIGNATMNVIGYPTGILNMYLNDHVNNKFGEQMLLDWTGQTREWAAQNHMEASFKFHSLNKIEGDI